MIKKVLLLVKDSFTESYRINLDQTGFLLVKDSFTENYRINLDQTGSFTRQRFFNRKLSKKSWSKSFFYKKLSMKFWSNMSYCFIQSQFLLKFEEEKLLFLWRKMLFLSITIFSPDFYQLATLAEQNNSFLCKTFDQFFTYMICIWCKESIFCRKK